jgi:hypothetical protein
LADEICCAEPSQRELNVVDIGTISVATIVVSTTARKRESAFATMYQEDNYRGCIEPIAVRATPIYSIMVSIALVVCPQFSAYLRAHMHPRTNDSFVFEYSSVKRPSPTLFSSAGASWIAPGSESREMGI